MKTKQDYLNELNREVTRSLIAMTGLMMVCIAIVELTVG